MAQPQWIACTAKMSFMAPDFLVSLSGQVEMGARGQDAGQG